MTEKPVINEEFQAFFPDIKITAPPGSGAVAKKSPQPDKNVLQAKVVPAAAPLAGMKEGIRLFNDKQWEQALKELLHVDAGSFTNDERSDLAYYLGLCCTKLERFDDAVLYLEQVVTASEDLLRIYQCRMTLAYIFVKTKRARMAEFELKRLRNCGFESVPLYNTLGYAAYSQKRFRNAIEYYESALELDKDNATAMNCMGYILIDTGLDLKKGLRYCRKAVEKNPQNAAYLDSLGWALHKCGDSSEARKLLRKALDTAPKEKEIREHLRIVSGEAS